MLLWATWKSESKAVKENVSPSWEVALWRQGSRQKHIIEGWSGVNEGSMHHSPQLLTLSWVTAKTLYIVLTRFCTLEYELSTFPWLRCTQKKWNFPTRCLDSFNTIKWFSSSGYFLFNHSRHAALLHHEDLWDKRVWQASFAHTEPTERCLQVSFNTIMTF